MRKNRSKRCWSGSLTVEASLVMILVISAVFSLLMLTLWLRDRSAVCFALGESLYTVQDRAGEKLRADLAELIVVRGGLSEFSAGESQRKAAWQGESLQFWPGITLSFEDTQERRIYRPAEFLRFCRTAQEFSSGAEAESAEPE